MPSTSHQAGADPIVDPVSGLPDLRYFLLAFDSKVALARRTLQPVSVVLMQIDDWDRKTPDHRKKALRHAAALMQHTVRASDVTCDLGAGRLAAILDEAAETGAVWAADRLRTVLTDRPGRPAVTLSVGIACYPTHALDADAVLEAAESALVNAAALGPARIEVAPLG